MNETIKTILERTKRQTLYVNTSARGRYNADS